MIRDLKPYPAYKDSGVEWLGQVPEHWEAIPVKRAYNIQLGKMLQNVPVSPEDILVPYFKAVHVQWSGVISKNLPTMWASPQDLNQYGVCPGDLLVCEGGEGGRCAIVKQLDGRPIIQNALHRVRPRGQSSNEFLQLSLRAIASTGWFEALNDKATIAHFTREKFATLQIALPPLPEQTAIVRFLDWAERRIRRVIRARQQRIKLLTEYKQALIHQAVTGRVDVRTGQPYPAYKDSGVEWLGQVPEHWDVRRLKRVGSVRIGLTYSPSDVSDESGTLVLRASNICNGRLVSADNVYVSKDVPTTLQVCEGDILICVRSGSRSLVGKCAIITKEFAGASYGAFMSLLKTIDNNFVYWALNSNLLPSVMAQFETSTINQLTQEDLKNLSLPFPPQSERGAIAAFLASATAKIDAAIAADRREIELLREYRTRLIADVVTGKVDVREVAARLPEEPSEEDTPWTDEEERSQDETLNGEGDHAAISEEDG